MTELLKEADRLKTTFLSNRLTLTFFITTSLENSTARAIRSTKNFKPTSIYRAWAYQHLQNESFQNDLRNQLNYKKIRSCAFKSFKNFWKKTDDTELAIHLANKVIDLFFKFLPLFSELTTKTREWLFDNANAPLDKYTLKALREQQPTLGIPKNASMGFVKTQKTYDKLQDAVRNTCGSTISALTFDLYAWEKGHPGFKPVKK